MRLTAILVALTALGAAPAAAYPQFQFSLGEGRCTSCHLAASGGGLLTDYGRDEAGSAISRGGDGRLLHGLWTPPSWLALGGDFRFAAGDKQLAGRNDRLAFPMQVDLYTRATTGSFSFALTAGVRGAARDPTPPLVERLTSREHYVAYEHGDYFARAGRFFPVFGLRLADHTAYVRRYLGFGLLEEPYGLELARGDDKSELAITAFVPPPIDILGAGYRAKGIAASYERHDADDRGLLGVDARFAVSPAESRATAGVFAKWWMRDAGVLWLAELDGQRQRFVVGPSRTQVAGYLGISKWLVAGLLVTGALQFWDPDVTLARSSRDAFELDVQYFPRAHFELHLLARAAAQGNNADDPGALALLQLHYYL